jgi:cell division protein FtsI/penicillin-binding protein 2
MERNNDLYTKEKRRMFIALLILMLLLSVIVAKLFWIQVISVNSYSSHGIDLAKNAVFQRQKSLVLNSGRGDIYDHNLRALTGETKQVLVVFPVNKKYRGEDIQIRELVTTLGVTKETWKNFTDRLRDPQMWPTPQGETPMTLTEEQAEHIRRLNLAGVKVVDYHNRYPTDMTAKQLVGFIGQNPQRILSIFGSELASGQMALTSRIGEAGLEKTFEPWLRGIGETSISYFTDNDKRPLQGLGARLTHPNNPYYPLKVVTTLDLNLQQQIETMMDKMDIREGAVVVLDAMQADIRAMASRPTFDPSAVDPSNGNWSNHALKAMSPGSIFKTVVAAAALEEGVVKKDETFHCNGELGKYGFTCWKKEGHGDLTLEQGYAQSCNIVFAKVMARLTSKQLESYANKLGLFSRVGWAGPVEIGQDYLHQLDAEEAGQLFAKQTLREDKGVLMQTAIGQRDVLVSPLQAANLVVTLLSGGNVYAPRVVSEVRYHNDRVLERFSVKKRDDEEAHISKATSRKLMSWMEMVVQDGTGKGLRGATWKLAGKSGTAQVVSGKKEKVNQWFIGFGPVENPRYAVSVVIENRGPEEINQAIPLFKGVMELIAASSSLSKNMLK